MIQREAKLLGLMREGLDGEGRPRLMAVNDTVFVSTSRGRILMSDGSEEWINVHYPGSPVISMHQLRAEQLLAG